MADVPPLEISVQETTERLASRAVSPVRLVDVRDPEEFEYNRLPSAELIPLVTIPMDAASKLPDREAEIIVYCHHGMRSMHAAQQLRAMGYQNVRSMAGGIDRWSREIDPDVPRY